MTVMLLALLMSDSALNASDIRAYRITEESTGESRETQARERTRAWKPGVDRWMIESRVERATRAPNGTNRQAGVVGEAMYEYGGVRRARDGRACRRFAPVFALPIAIGKAGVAGEGDRAVVAAGSRCVGEVRHTARPAAERGVHLLYA